MEVINNDTFIKFGMNPLNKFMEGNIAENYINKEEKGFPIQGTIGPILNVNPQNNFNKINDGLVVNPLFKTIDPGFSNRNDFLNSENNIGINQISPTDNNWVNPKIKQPRTPITYCKDDQVSELLPRYPNGIVNKNLYPNCETLTLDNKGSPLLYGASTFGINDSSLLNNPNNNIGHEVNTFGLANQTGSRALGQGKTACKKMLPGFNVPSLEVSKNENGAYISSPVPFNDEIPLYQVGDWTKIPDNFLYNFENSQFCK